MANRLHSLLPDTEPRSARATITSPLRNTVAFADINGSPDAGYYVEIVWSDSRSVTNLPPYKTWLEAKRVAVEELVAIASANYKDWGFQWTIER